MGQPPIPPIPAGTNLVGKTVIITGGNSGMGFEAARQFLCLQASRVIVTVRSQSKGLEAVSALRADPTVKATNPSAVIEAFILDLDDYKSGLRFAEKVKREVTELDVLLCNAGINIMRYEPSKSGHERVMQVNCYTHFLIALELLPLLQATARERGTPSRLCFVGSSMQRHHTLTSKPVAASDSVLTHFNDRQIYDKFRRYGDSKLLLNAFVHQLATTIPSHEVIVNNVCPGLVATGFDKQLPAWLWPIMYVMRKAVARTVEEGGRALISASILAGPDTHGKFIQNNKVDPGAPFLTEPDGKYFINRFWSDILADIRLVDPLLKSGA